MNWLTMFRSKKDNPFYEKLKGVNARQPFAHSIKRAFYLGGFAYTSEGCELVQKAISANRLHLFLEEVNYNTQENNIELYLVEDEAEQSNVVVILDPFELYNREELLKVISCNMTLLERIEETQQICP